MAAALLDPNTYRKDGTAALAGESVSWNGNLFGYAVAQAGSDWAEWRIRDVATGKDATDLIQWTKGTSISWAADDRGFYYSRFAQPPPEKLLTVAALNEKVYFHRLGDPQFSTGIPASHCDRLSFRNTLIPKALNASRRPDRFVHLIRHSIQEVADAFCATRLADEGGRTFGTLPSHADFRAILERAR